MEIRVLGPLEVLDGSAIEIRRPKDRALLAMLAAEAGTTVSADRLIDGLWGEEAPATALGTLRTYIHHLRSLLPDGSVATDGRGYRLDCDPDAVDAERFPQLVAAARGLLEEDPAVAGRLLEEAMELWRGTPFEDADRAEWLRPLRTRLEGLRLQAVVDSIDTRLRLGDHDAAIPELRSLVEEHPLREDVWAMLMTALYRAGRQAEALRAYASARRVLVEELGIDPGPELQQLEARVLAQDPGLLFDEATPSATSLPDAEDPPAPDPGAAVSPPPLPPERRRVTLVCVELVGLEELRSQIGTTTADVIAEEARAIVTEAVADFGTTAERAGDALLIAPFGLPVARDDDAYRAIRAALASRERIAAHATETRRSWHTDGIAVRVAVASADLTTRGSHVEHPSVVSQRVAELAAVAEPDQVLVADHTKRRLEDLFVWGPEPLTIDGSHAWPVHATVAPGDKVRMSRRIHAPLVGRAHELETLEAAIGELQRGLGGVIWIGGDAGVGKTRLVEELRESTRPGTRWLIGHCAAFAEAMPYWPIRDLMRDWLALGVDDTEMKTRVALRTGLEQELDSADRLYPYLAAMLGVELEGSDADRIAVAPEALQYRTFEVIGELVGAMAGRVPLVVAVEDVHWIDPTSLQLLERLIELTDETALLLILTSRPDPDHPSHRLGELARRRLPHRLLEFHLESLSGPDQQAMLDALIGAETLPTSTRRRLLDLAEGNPFYLEELVGSLVDEGALVTTDAGWVFDHEVTLSVPETVEKVVQARIDRLDADAHELITSAAVLGRSFGLPLLQGVLGEPGGLIDAIHRLLRLDLLIQARRWPQAEYLFKHALIQEAAYGTLPVERRRQLHRRAAEWLEQRHTSSLDEVAGLLAGHWVATGDDERAAAALLRAGDVARREHALDEAVDHYRTLLPILERMGDRRTTALVLLRLGHALHTALRFAECNAAYQEAFQLWEYEPSPPAVETLRFAGPPWWRPVDPIRSYWLQDMQLQMALFDRLVERWPDDTLVPSLAERWEVSDDGLRYRFTLREGLLWSDGRPLTAADAAFGVLRNLDPEDPGISVSMLYVIEGARAHLRGDTADRSDIGVRAVDDRTVEFRLTAPAPYLLSMLNRPDCGPQPQHVIERHGDEWHHPEHIATSGAFRRVEASANHVVLERRPDYQGSRFGNVARVEWQTGPSSLAVQAYLDGELDLLWLGRGWHGDHVGRLQADVIFPEPHAGLTYLFFDVANRWAAERDFRLALAHGIDREALVDALPGDETVATGGVVPPPLAGHTPDITVPFDPARARDLLDRLGHDAVVRIATFERFQPEADAVAEMWRRHLDLEVEVDTIDDPTHWLALPTAGHDYAVFPSTWYPGYTDPEYFLRLLLASDAVDNHGRWSHGPYDALIERATSARTEQERLELFHAADRMAVVEQVAVIPLAYAWNTSVRGPHVEGWWEFGKSWANFADLTVTRPG